MLYQTKNPHGGDIYGAPIDLDYSANTNPLGTPKGVQNAIIAALPDVHHYPDPYCRKLVAAIAAHEQLPESFILCGNGAAELIDSYCGALRPRKAVELAPTFAEYSNGLERAGCAVSRYTLGQENGFKLDRGFLDFLEAEQPEAVFLCNPNNPTGQLIAPALLEEILTFCRERSIRMFLDECFLDFTDQGVSVKDRLEECPNLFILRAFTKSYGMAGVRLGYGLCADPALLTAMSRSVQPWNISSLAQAAGVAALQEGDFLEAGKAIIRTERVWLRQQLEACGFWVCPTETNYMLFRGPERLHGELLNRRIAIRNCGNYHGLEQGWYRIAVRTHPENAQLMDAIHEICN